MKNTIIAVLIVGFVVLGFLYINQSKTPEIATTTTTEFNGAIGPSDPPSATYEFGECASSNVGSTPCWDYALSLYEEKETIALITVNGFQTQYSLVGILQDNGDIVFDHYQLENNPKPFQKGDILLSIKKTPSGDMLVTWKKLQSNILNSTEALFLLKR